MTKKRAGIVLSVLLALLMIIAGVASLLPLSVAAAESPLQLKSDVSTPGSDDDSFPPAMGEGVEIVSYKIMQPGGVVPEKITKGTSFSLYIRIHDTRAGVTSNLTPTANLNTASFTTDSANYPNVTKHKVSTGNSFTLDFPLTYTGTGSTFQCDFYYKNNNTIAYYPISITFNQTVEYVETPDDSSDSSSTVVRGTDFVLTGASFGGPNVLAGNTFTLTADLLSTNGTYAVENVSVGISLPKEISLATGQSISYVGRVAPNQSIPASFELLASAVAEEGSYVVTLNISGVNAEDGSPVKNDMEITIPLAQPERFEISNVQVPDYLTAGMDDGAGYSMIYLVNKGKGTIYNVTVYVEGEGLSTDMGRQFIGNINPGSEGNADFNIMADTPGQIDAKVVVEYENTQGEQKMLFHEFSITVAEGGWDGGDGGIDPFPIEPEPEEPQGMPVWVWIVIGAGVVVVIIVVIVILRKRKAKKAAADLEDDSDEDF